MPGLVVYESTLDVPQTVKRVQDGLSSIGKVAATVDYAAAAASIGEQLRPTTVVIGGAPAAGTPILDAAQQAGIDLPQKYLVWQEESGKVLLGYNSVEYIAQRAGLEPSDGALDKARTGSAGIASAASGSNSPVAQGTESVTSDGYLVQQVGDASVVESIARYEAAFRRAGLTPVATVDHSAAAASAQQELRPTSVTFVGNPKVATALVGVSQTFGIDLPVRYEAWQDAQGQVHVGHPDIRVLAERHGAEGVDDTLAMVEKVTAGFTATAAGR